MGTPVPPEWPELEDDKWYRVGVDVYWDAFPETGCDQAYQGRTQCCVPGWFIKEWKAAGHECLSPNELCPVMGISAQRLIFCHGPYPSWNACSLDLEL